MGTRTAPIVAGVGLLCLAGALTFFLSTRERYCRPLDLQFDITAKESPARGRSWDLGSREARRPDPTGRVVVTTDGKRYIESIAQRKNTYAFRGRFYAKRGVPLRRGSKISALVLDKDMSSAEHVGEISHEITGTHRGSATSSNGALKLSYTCHSDDGFFGIFSKKSR